MIDTNIARLYPALKNIIAYHQRRGDLPPLRTGEALEPDAQGQGKPVRTVDCCLYWCLIDTDLPMAFWESCDEVELVVSYDDFRVFAHTIRGRVGTLYLDACDEFAKTLVVNSRRPIAYIPPKASVQAIASSAPGQQPKHMVS